VKVDFSVPEKYAPAVRAGQRIEFRVAGSDRLHTGQIDAVEPKVDTGTRNILIRARAPNTEGAIAPGGFAEVDLVLEDFAGALMIPTPSLVPDVEGQRVFVARNGVVEVRRITTGIRTESDVQVLTGLGAGDTVLTSGILQVVPGMPVRLTEVR
jgi:membrane fusion protein (multidrug efflux system)